MADPIGSVNGMGPILIGFTITVPSMNGAKPGRNLDAESGKKTNFIIGQIKEIQIVDNASAW